MVLELQQLIGLKVDFPEAEGPIKATNSPGAIMRRNIIDNCFFHMRKTIGYLFECSSPLGAGKVIPALRYIFSQNDVLICYKRLLNLVIVPNRDGLLNWR